MTFEAWMSLGVAVAVLLGMVASLAAPDMLMLAGVTALLFLGVIEPSSALSGFSNPAVLSVAALLVVASGMRETGVLDYVADHVLGKPRSDAHAQVRLMVPVATVSAFMNNTPVVAMMLPVVTDWARRSGKAASRLLIPLSYASILGGTCTLIGTSTNLVVAGLAETRQGISFGLFDLAVVGLPCTLAGMLFIVLTSRFLLPAKDNRATHAHDPREYTVAMRVESGSPIVGKSVQDAGLRHLPGLYLVEINRDGHAMVAVGPEQLIRAGDRLIFAGVVDSVVDLRNIRGLEPDTNQVQKLEATRTRRLVEAVVAARSPLVGRNVRETRFRTSYNAAIIAVHRRGERLGGKIGDIVLQAGDTLLLESHPSFVQRHRHDANFALMSEVAQSTTRRRDRAGIAAAAMGALVLTQVTGALPLLTASLGAAGIMLVTRCLTPQEARRALDLPVLISIASAFGIAAALEETGAASVLASGLVAVAIPIGSLGVLAALFLTTSLISSVVTNNAAAALMFPVATAAAEVAEIDMRATLLVLMLAASTSFATPIGYQTNLMVLGPGGYSFRDFFRIGVPLQVVVGVVAVVVAQWAWL